KNHYIMPMAKIAPSVLGANFARLGDDIAEADRVGVDLFHLDIMDGHFVPNISYGPEVVKTIDKLTNGLLDVHLMLSQPERYFEAFVKAGADNITFHIEVHPDPVEKIAELRKLNVQTGLSLNPDTPIERVLPFLEQVDFLLVMSVFPGFGGQEFIEDTLPKITTAREFIDKQGLPTQLQVDGGVEESNAAKVVQAGADILVMGTGFFEHPDRQALTRMVHGLTYSSPQQSRS
ncbi:MAG: ribulose-phosphate 3-epimerase, partial [Candidatus Zixiibacteriota bacterium]